jgi:hypothetical protein
MGKDRIDHGPGGHDDLCNSAAGALVLAVSVKEWSVPITMPEMILRAANSPSPYFWAEDPSSVQRPGGDWSAPMVDVDPDTDDYRMRWRRVSECFVRIPGKHRSRDAACEALENMMATRH